MMFRGPNSIEALLQVIPGLRRIRTINAPWLRVLFDRQKKECTWCGERVPKGCSTWCGRPCVEAFKMRCSSNHYRAAVEIRDRAICQICGRDTVAAEQEAKTRGLKAYFYRGNLNDEEYLVKKQEVENELLSLGYSRGVWREVDHILPVVMGGGLCGLENLRLVCGACHAGETAKLAKSRSGKHLVES